MGEENNISKGLFRFVRRAIIFVTSLSLPLVLLLIGGLLCCLIAAVAAGLSAEERQKTTNADMLAGNLAIPREYIALAVKYGEMFALEPELILAIMECESGFSPNATSYVGAKWLMQVMPATFTDAKSYARSLDIKQDSYTYEDIFNPDCNVKYACAYLAKIRDNILPKGASIKTIAAAYNAGPYVVLGWLKNPNLSSDGVHLIEELIPYGETRAYAKKVGKAYQAYKSLDGSFLLGEGEAANIIDGKVSSQGWLWPAPNTTIITSGVGPRWGRSHNGIDIAGANCYGNPIVAAKDGIVIVAVHSGWGGGYGCHVYIDHGNGYIARYAHASQIIVQVGDAVKQGQVIGYIGSTGDSTGPHLHFEIRLGEAVLDPELYVTAQ